MYWYSYVAGWLHFASVAPCWHCHGWVWGPEKTGPPFAWLTTVAESLPPGAAARMVFSPSFSPVTRPMSRPSPAGANASLTSRPLAVTRTADAVVPEGTP